MDFGSEGGAASVCGRWLFEYYNYVPALQLYIVVTKEKSGKFLKCMFNITLIYTNPNNTHNITKPVQYYVILMHCNFS